MALLSYEIIRLNPIRITVKTHHTYLKNIIPDCFAVAEKQSNSNAICTNTMIVSVNLIVVLAATNLKIVSITCCVLSHLIIAGLKTSVVKDKIHVMPWT